MIAPDTLRCTANMLEGDGIKHILKKILHPDTGVEIESYISDGDHKNQVVMDTLKWDEEDEVPRHMIGQLVVQNKPTRYQGMNIIIMLSLRNHYAIITSS